MPASPFEKYLQLLVIALLLCYISIAGIAGGWKMQSDFPNYYVASKLVADHKDVSRIYDNDWFQQQLSSYGIDKPGKFTPFPPPTALLFLPFTVLDVLAAKRIWLLMNVLLCIPLLFLIRRVSGFPFRVCALMLLVTGLGLANNFYLGQVYLLILFCMFAGNHLIARNKKFTGGIIWGIAAAFKFVPVILLIPFFIRKDLKVVTGFFSGFIFIHVGAWMLMGSEVYVNYFSVFAQHLNGSIEGQSPFAYQFQSWDAFLRNVFVFDAKENAQPFYSSVLSFEIVRMLVYAAVIFITVRLLFLFRKEKNFTAWAFAITGISFFEILPASATYHFILLLFPFLFLAKKFVETGEKKKFELLLLLFSAIGCLPIILQKLIPPSSPFIFYRLWLMTLFYVAGIYFLFQVKASTKTSLTAAASK